jgi:hypothetical protein
MTIEKLSDPNKVISAQAGIQRCREKLIAHTLLQSSEKKILSDIQCASLTH